MASRGSGHARTRRKREGKENRGVRDTHRQGEKTRGRVGRRRDQHWTGNAPAVWDLDVRAL